MSSSKKTWTRRALVAELKRLARGKRPTKTVLVEAHGAAFAAAVEEEFGTLREACRAAGLATQLGRYVDADTVIEGLRELHSRGVRLTSRAMVAMGEARLVSAIYRHFANLPDALEHAGLTTPPPLDLRIPLDEAAAELRDVHQRLGRTPPQKELRVGAVKRLREHYGSWTAVLDAFEMEPVQAHRRWTPETVTARLRELHSQGVRITSSALLDAGHADVMLGIQRCMSSFVEARALAGLSPPDERASFVSTDSLHAARIRSARGRYAAGGISQHALATELGVSLDQMKRLLIGEVRRSAGGPLHQPSPRSRLNPQQVVLIRRRFASGRYTKAELARCYSVGTSTIDRVVTGASYRSVGGPRVAREATHH